MVDDELVDRPGPRDENGHARLRTPACPAHLLPRCRDGAGVPGEDRNVEPADVDAELEGIGADHAQDFARPKAGFDRPTLGGQVPAAIATDPTDRALTFTEVVPKAGQDELDGMPRSTEHDRLAPGAQECQGRPTGKTKSAAPHAQPRIDERRVEHDYVLLPGGSPVAVDDGHWPAGKRLGQHLRIPDRRRAANDLRPAPVVVAQPQEPPEHVGDVTAEHAAVRVRLVDNYVAQLLEQLEPLRVMRQDPGMEHVRVGHDDLAGSSDR